MQKNQTSEIRDSSRSPSNVEVPYSSNCVRLSPREWLVIGIVFSAFLCLVPALWERIEKFEPGPDYRLPYELSSDYRLQARYCRWATSQYETLVIGDSVVWGHFVSKDNTLSYYLNENTGRNHFANLGVDGIHPVALAGLLKYYGRNIKDANVILHFNPLWMTSRKHDLQIDKEFHFNHPKLVPQFTPDIPCYKDSYSRRLWAVVERYVTFLSWTSHLKIAYFESMDLPAWTVEHPYENPLKAVTLKLPSSENDYQSERISWKEKGTPTQDFQWVELGTSLQWNFFRRSVEILKTRGNTVFVLVGPFNEHMMKGKSIDTYRKMKTEIEAWLRQNNVPYYMPEALPGDLYADASHPLSEGYATLAKELLENESFRSSILRPE
ncbi:MAG: hypothetical protein ACYS6W_09085 [Planctomycetota bacterium]|jgi:hypothetical protein